ncbi:hypothetical protein BYT27DRAFT_6549605 [Phlegmacium glaucopus]|nr:hypothetical protein BYT27DRAFT_6549605 [Phlegmacium glaucopus]
MTNMFLFILELSTPIRQNQALYQYLVMQFTREEENTTERVGGYEDTERNGRSYLLHVPRALVGEENRWFSKFPKVEMDTQVSKPTSRRSLFPRTSYLLHLQTTTLIEINDIRPAILSRAGAGAGALTARTFDLNRHQEWSITQLLHISIGMNMK